MFYANVNVIFDVRINCSQSIRDVEMMKGIWQLDWLRHCEFGLSELRMLPEELLERSLFLRKNRTILSLKLDQSLHGLTAI